MPNKISLLKKELARLETSKRKRDEEARLKARIRDLKYGKYIKTMKGIGKKLERYGQSSKQPRRRKPQYDYGGGLF